MSVAGCHPPRAAVTSEDIEILRAALAETCRVSGEKYSVLSSDPAAVAELEVPARWGDTTSFSAELKSRAKFRARWPHIDLCKKVRIEDELKIAATFKKQEFNPPIWDFFYKAFPGASGLIYVSLPAVDAEGDAAIVYLTISCDVLCASGHLLKLEKRSRGWIVVESTTAWIS